MPRLLRVVSATLAAAALLGSCDKGSRQDRFCRQLAEEQSLLATVPEDAGDLDDFVSRYQELDRIAPLAIEEQWHTITELVVAVSTTDLQDPASADRLRDQAVAATRSVDEVRAYARTTCGVDLLLASVGVTASTIAPGATPTTGATTSSATPATPSATAPPTLPGTVPPTVP